MSRDADVDYAAAAVRMTDAATWLSAIGFRLAILLAYLAPVWLERRPRTLAALEPRQRGELLGQMLEHRIHLVRELCLLLKLIACMAIFQSADLRARSGNDVPVDWRDGEVEQSGEQPRWRPTAVAAAEESLDEASAESKLTG